MSSEKFLELQTLKQKFCLASEPLFELLIRFLKRATKKDGFRDHEGLTNSFKMFVDKVLKVSVYDDKYCVLKIIQNDLDSIIQKDNTVNLSKAQEFMAECVRPYRDVSVCVI